MQFIVCACSKNVDTRAVDLPNIEVGLKLLGELRKAAGKDLDISVIKSYVNSYSEYRVEIAIPEKLAIQCNDLFNDKNIVYIKVPDKHLNQYASIVPIIDLEGDIPSAHMEYHLDGDKFIKDWMEAGCPTTLL